MQIGVFFDPSNPEDRQRAQAFIAGLAPVAPAPTALRLTVEEILALGSGELLRIAHQYFGTGRFNLVTLAQRSGREVASLHSLAANLGRVCDKREIEVFDRHGGQPLELSVRAEVAQVLDELAE